MQVTHTVHTDDGSIRLDLADESTIFDLIARGANGAEVTVHLGYHQARYLLGDAGSVRLAFGTNTATEHAVQTMGGVVEVDQPPGQITFTLPARSTAYTLTVDARAGARTTLTLAAGAHDRLMVGLGTLLGQL